MLIHGSGTQTELILFRPWEPNAQSPSPDKRMANKRHLRTESIGKINSPVASVYVSRHTLLS